MSTKRTGMEGVAPGGAARGRVPSQRKGVEQAKQRRNAMLVGLTGGLAMGKSTVRRMVEEELEAVFDADEAVHSLYRQDRAAHLVEHEFPGVRSERGEVDRAELAKRVVGDDDALRRLECVVHPLVAEQRAEFVRECEQEGRSLCFLEVPLLFETGAQSDVHEVVVVSTEDEVEQRRRALQRPGMTHEKIDAILRRQLPDNERRARADHLINTVQPVERTRACVSNLLASLKQKARRLARTGSSSD